MTPTLHLADLVHRALPPEPWAEGDNIPWDEPSFSARMLRWHLVQDTDSASRRTAKIDAQVAWIYAQVLHSAPARVLDLACGPGLYTARLARLGCTCLGIDFGPASIAYAREHSAGLACAYELRDIRQADYGGPHDLAMLIYGQFNVFKPQEAREIVRRAWQALRPGGVLLLEPHTFAAVQETAHPANWSAEAAGLFAAEPHILLNESFWDAERAASTERYYVVDGATGAVTRYALSMQAYTDADYAALLGEAGFTNVTFHPSLIGEPDASQKGLLAITAQRPGKDQRQAL